MHLSLIHILEFDGSRVDCCELVQTKEMSEVEDHKIEVIGPDVDEMELGSKNSIAYIVEVAGKSMQPDFEPVIERKFHNYINCIEGVYPVSYTHLDVYKRQLEERMTSKVGLLSGGQRQALTLLMASLKKPKVLLLDEHTAA